MIRIVALLVLMATWACCTRPACATEPPEADGPRVEETSVVELPAGWRWDRPVPAHAQRRGDAIQMRTEAGRIWAGEGSQNRIITKAPIGDVADASAEIELVDAVGKWEQCGLLVYQHDDSFVKLVVEHIDGEHFVVMAREIGKQREVLAKIEIPHAVALLRLRVNGTNVSGFWRSDSQDWKSAAETELPREKSRHFAVFSQDGDADNPRHAMVRGLRYSQDPAPQ